MSSQEFESVAQLEADLSKVAFPDGEPVGILSGGDEARVVVSTMNICHDIRDNYSFTSTAEFHALNTALSQKIGAIMKAGFTPPEVPAELFEWHLIAMEGSEIQAAARDSIRVIFLTELAVADVDKCYKLQDTFPVTYDTEFNGALAARLAHLQAT